MVILDKDQRWETNSRISECENEFAERQRQRVDIRMLYPASHKLEIDAQRKSPMKINGGKSLKQKIGVEMRFKKKSVEKINCPDCIW